MHNEFHKAFDQIHATDLMKQNSTQVLQQEILKRQRKTYAPLRYAFACCSLLVLLLCSFGGYQFYQTPVSFISVDVNPSVELSLNYFDRIVSASAYNDDAALVLQNLNLKNKSYTEAIELLLNDKLFSGYLAEDALLSFTVISSKEEALLAGIKGCRGYETAATECHGSNKDLMEQAHHNGLSFGKYQAYLELAQYDSTITPQDCQSLSMRQIRDLISQYQGDTSLPDTDIGNGNGKGHGNGYGHGNGNGKGHGSGKGNGHGYRGGFGE